MDTVTWGIDPVDLRAVRRLAGELEVSPVLAEILVRRGLSDPDAAREFLSPSCRLRDPFLLPGMEAARRRLDRALGRDEPILVFGDYDADGVTATFVLAEALRDLGAEVRTRLPERLTEGYGLSVAAVEEAAAAGIGLVITVDCGIRDHEAVTRAGELGLDVVVTDHHETGETLPDCIVVSPKLDGSPFADLAGVGVAFKLAHALFERPASEWVEVPLRLRRLLDAVAIGTIADVVPLVDENRTLAYMGLAEINAAPRPGVVALLEVSGGVPSIVDEQTVAFRLAPRINAAGRLGDATAGLELFAARERGEAIRLAHRLHDCNAERREIERGMYDQALEMVPDPRPPAVVVAAPGWHEGVAGIVAGRLAEETRRPTVVLCSGDEVARGSGRSIPGYDLLAAVGSSSETLLGFGGHAAACGLRLPTGDIPAFRESFCRHVAETLDPALLRRRHPVDAVVGGTDLTLRLAEELGGLAPHGAGNPPVGLLVPGARIEGLGRTRDGKHLRCRVRADGTSAGAIHFRYEGAAEFGERRFDVPLQLVVDSFGGTVKAQARLQALVPLEEGRPDLCPTDCDRSCRERLDGDALLAELERLAETWRDLQAGCAGVEESFEEAAAEGRLDDRRGRPVLPSLAGVLAAGGRTLLLVADVARRRPLLTRDVSLDALGRRAAYVAGACAAGRLPDLLSGDRAPSLLMAASEAAATLPELVAVADRVVFLDPPLSGEASAAVLAAAPDADVHLLWGPTEVGFADRVLQIDYDLDRLLRRLYRTMVDNGGDAGAAVLAEHARGALLTEPAPLAAALRVLGETGLAERAAGKDPSRERVDLQTSETYRAWHRRYPTKRRRESSRTTTG